MKNTFLESPVIALQHIKNLARAIEKLYTKPCVRKGSLRVIYTTILSVMQAQLIAPRVQTRFKAQKSTLVHDFSQ